MPASLSFIDPCSLLLLSADGTSRRIVNVTSFNVFPWKYILKDVEAFGSKVQTVLICLPQSRSAQIL